MEQLCTMCKRYKHCAHTSDSLFTHKKTLVEETIESHDDEEMLGMERSTLYDRNFQQVALSTAARVN